MGSALSSERPAFATATMLRFVASEDPLVCLVAASDAQRLVLTAPQPSGASASRPVVGSRAEVSWTDDGLRMVPVELVGVQKASVPLWHFRVVGPVERVQRRYSVRTPLHLPVQVSDRGRHLVGFTSDLSEGGCRCTVTDTSGAIPASGDVVDVALFLDLDDNPLRARAFVRRRAQDDPASSLILQFQELTEQDQDRIRARVFLELRSHLAGEPD